MAALRQRAQEQAAEFVRLAKARGGDAVTGGKARAAAQLAGVGGAVRRAAEKLQDQQSGAVAEYVQEAAERVEGAARYLEDHTVVELADDAAALARRRPAWFLGGMFLAGLAAAALLKATAPVPEHDREPGEPPRGNQGDTKQEGNRIT